MIIKTNGDRSDFSAASAPAGSRQLTVPVIAVVASIAAGIGAYTFLSATHPAPNRLSWSLQPPKGTKVAAPTPAPANLQAADQPLQRRARAL